MKHYIRGFAAVVLCAQALLPSPLEMVCVPDTVQGCYEDAANRTFPVVVSTQPSDPYHGNMTLETCGYLCAKLGHPIAGVEIGSQCFCANTVSNLTAYLRPMSDCSTGSACAGNTFQTCGGAWRVLAYNVTCTPYNAANASWLDTGMPISSRIDDLMLRLSSAPSAPSMPGAATPTLPPSLLAQLVQNGADIYSPAVQLPRYIVSQECLAGYNGGQIYIAPPMPQLPSSSAFPQPANMGHTMDPSLVAQVASAIGDEARAAWVHYDRPSLTCISPNLNVARAPQWGRSVESYGEDPTLIGVLGQAYVRGMQVGGLSASMNSSQWKVFAMPKHIGAYSVEGCMGDQSYPDCTVYRSFFNAIVDDIDMREGYLPGWESAIVRGGAVGVMCSYNALNGVPMCGNGRVLQDILRGEYGMTGPVISDADAVSQIWAPYDTPPGHGYTAGGASWLGAAVSGLTNGTTISLEDDPTTFTPGSFNKSVYHSQINAALAAGLITQEQVLSAVRAALLPRFLVGLYDPPGSVPWNNISAGVIESQQNHALARKAAADSYVLLQNNNSFLPLRPPSTGGPKTIAVVGPSANCTSCIIGRYTGQPARVVTPWLGIQSAVQGMGGTAVYGGSMGPGAVSAVSASDLGIVLLSGNTEGESKDREDIGLPEDQQDFLAQLAATGVPLIVCSISGGAVDISPALPLAHAVLALHVGGMEAGSALADVLWGAVNPSGALAVTIYRTSWQNASDFYNMSLRSSPGRGHRWLTPDAQAEHVLFPFAYGLGYTTWSNAVSACNLSTISAAALAAGSSIGITVSVSNRGRVSGSRVVLLFLSRQGEGPGTGWPSQWIAQSGVDKVHDVAPGATAYSTFTLMARDFSRWVPSAVGPSLAGAWQVQPGVYELRLRDDAQGGAPGQPQAGAITVTA